MATTLTLSRIRGPGEGLVWVAAWNLSNTETGDSLENPTSPDRSVQVDGTFGVGGTVVIEGSNNGTTYRTLTDPQGNALSFTTASLEAVSELTRYIRPRVTAGDGTTAITVHIIANGQVRG